MHSTRPSLRVYGAPSDTTSAAGRDALQERGRLAVLAAKVATSLYESGTLLPVLVVPSNDDLDQAPYVDPTERNVSLLGLRDTPHSSNVSRYSAVVIDGKVHLARGERVFVMPGKENELSVKHGLQSAGTDDFAALKPSLRVLVEVAKYKTTLEREELIEELGETRAKNIPNITMDSDVRKYADELFSPFGLMMRTPLADNGKVFATFDATKQPEVPFGELSDRLSRFESDAAALDRFAARNIGRPDLGLIGPGADVIPMHLPGPAL